MDINCLGEEFDNILYNWKNTSMSPWKLTFEFVTERFPLCTSGDLYKVYCDIVSKKNWEV